MDALKKAIEIVGSQAALAEAIGIKQSRIAMWLSRGSRVPGELCAPIERATGGQITRQQLRPDIEWIIAPSRRGRAA